MRQTPPSRLPPGQSRTEKWPVLHYGAIPRIDLATWEFTVTGEVEAPRRWSWEEFTRLPKVSVRCDIHCVTAGGAEALFLEEREVGPGPRGAARRPAGILGAERVPHARRSLEGRALLRSLVGAGQAQGSITTFIESGAIDFRTAASASLSAYRWETNDRRGYCPVYRAIWRRLGP